MILADGARVPINAAEVIFIGTCGRFGRMLFLNYKNVRESVQNPGKSPIA